MRGAEAMTDVTKMSDEELLTWAQVCLDSDSTYEGMDLARELASRLEAALERERLDVETIRGTISAFDEFHPEHEIERFACWQCNWRFALEERLAARSKA